MNSLSIAARPTSQPRPLLRELGLGVAPYLAAILLIAAVSLLGA